MEKIIKKGSLSNINLRELISYRHFILNQFWRNINVIYKQTAFGSVYRILIPIIQSGLFAVIFSEPANAIHVEPPKPVLFCKASTSLFLTETPSILSLIAVFKA